MVPAAADSPKPSPINARNPSTLASTRPSLPAVISNPHPNNIMAHAASIVSKNRAFFPGAPLMTPAAMVPSAVAASMGSSIRPASRALFP